MVRELSESLIEQLAGMASKFQGGSCDKEAAILDYERLSSARNELHLGIKHNFWRGT